MSIRELLYLKQHFNQVLHATLNPDGPGAIRLHMIPPKASLFHSHTALLILNGNKILPINLSWAILLSCFLIELNEYGTKEIPKNNLDKISEEAIRNTKSVYPEAHYSELKRDLSLIIDTLCDVACGKPTKVEIGPFSLKDYLPYMKAPFCMDLIIDPQVDKWSSILERCKKIGIPQLNFQCSDTSLQETILPIISQAEWFYTRLDCSALILNEEYCRKLKEAELDGIEITLYSSDEAIHNQLSGYNNFEATVQNICSALKAGFHVNVHTPLCSLNTDYLSTLIFLKGLSVEYVSCSLLSTSENLPQSEELYQILDTATDYCCASHLEISFTTSGLFSKKQIASLGLSNPESNHFLNHMSVTSKGDVSTTTTPEHPSTLLGNLLTDDWKSIWNSKACTELRKEVE